MDEAKAEGYIGREALARIRREGVRRQLVGLEIAGDPLEFNFTKWLVRAGGESIGRVTSAVWSPRLRKNIGYAMVPSAQAPLGTALEVAIPDRGERTARVVARPFLEPGSGVLQSRATAGAVHGNT